MNKEKKTRSRKGGLNRLYELNVYVFFVSGAKIRLKHPEACRLIITNEEDPDGEPYVLLAHALDNDRENHMMGTDEDGEGIYIYIMIYHNDIELSHIMVLVH